MHVLIPSNSNATLWQTVTDIKTMEAQLLQHGQQHFQKAEGTPFTQDPLKSLLGNHSLTLFGDNIYHGDPINPTLSIDPTTWHLLENQRNAIP